MTSYVAKLESPNQTKMARTCTQSHTPYVWLIRHSVTSFSHHRLIFFTHEFSSLKLNLIEHIPTDRGELLGAYARWRLRSADKRQQNLLKCGCAANFRIEATTTRVVGINTVCIIFTHLSGTFLSIFPPLLNDHFSLELIHESTLAVAAPHSWFVLLRNDNCVFVHLCAHAHEVIWIINAFSR